MAADPRVLFANERTLLAWLRTGLALITFGFGVAQLGQWLRQTDRIQGTSQAEMVGAVFAILGAVGQILALLRYARIRRAVLRGEVVPTDARAVVAVVGMVAALGLLLGGYVLLG